MKIYIQEINGNITTMSSSFMEDSIEIEVADDFNPMTSGQYRYIGGELVKKIFPENIAELEMELHIIQEWFNFTDWMSNKILTGEWTTEDPRWQQYLMERSIKRNRQDELNALLGDDN